ncbi:MAG: amidohydrolase family protein, partial [Erysipelotrichaceae bacterium]|nr:amidohydrolase family protein [Erysipelotrichaceae bacterium]
MSKYLIKNVNILDGTYQMKLKEGYDILIEDGKIVKIDQNISYEGKVLDGKGQYVIPGLINLHVHLPATGKVGKKKLGDLRGLVKFMKSNPICREIGIGIGASSAKMELLSGVTTLRAVGGVSNFDTKLADRIKKGKTAGPRILASNEAICTPGGHMEGTVSVAVNSVEEAEDLVEKTAKDGADLIKLMITGGVLDCKVKGHPGDLKMDEEMVKACCDRAHELGLKVAAHVEGPEGVEIACRAGVDTIEHGAPPSDEAISILKERNGALVCTLSPAIPLYKIDPS